MLLKILLIIDVVVFLATFVYVIVKFAINSSNNQNAKNGIQEQTKDEPKFLSREKQENLQEAVGLKENKIELIIGDIE